MTQTTRISDLIIRKFWPVFNDKEKFFNLQLFETDAQIIDRSGAESLIPEDRAAEIIQGAIAQSAVLTMGRRLANMTAAQTRLPVLDALPIAYFVNGDTGQKKTTRQAWDKKTMRYSYFDSEITGVDSEGMPIFDRAETSELFRLLFSKLLTNGVLAKPADCFKVLAGDTGLSVKVQPGFGLINGAFAYDPAVATFQLAAAPTSYSRIDRIVLRCNYLERLCEIIVKTGTAAATPQPPELIQPVSGDYYELGLALVTVGANQSALTQSSITDTRPNSAVCGYITQFIDSIDTEAFYDQFNAFYAEFVAKSNASYALFEQMAKTAYNGFTAAIDEYIEALETKGNTDLTAITEAMKEFQRTSQNAFNEWFATVQGLLDEDVAGRLINKTSDLDERLTALEYMIIHNDLFTHIVDDDGNPILDDGGNAIIPKSKRAYSNLEAHHKALEIRRKIAVELLASFAYSEKKLEEAVRKQTQHIQDPEHRAEAAQAIRNLEEDFACWFIKRHRDRVDDLCCDIAQHLRGANTIWPTYHFEYKDRRGELNQALKCCNKLQDELQYIAESLPADKNKYMDIVLEVEALFNMIKALRQSDNRFLKHLKD